MSNVIEFEPFRERQLGELTRHAMKLPRYRRLALMVALCERLRDSRRTRPRPAEVARHPASR